ncbi:FAD/NAD(P)-binding domain-containing protein [Daedaleopsis nitida]|nr:FAD/NAD(P)-binding domain-containing protein [Daedaleopsis nitida]
MSDTTLRKAFQVAIVGGGVCGVTCAVALQRAGVPFQLFESASGFGEIGAGIGMSPNAVRILEALGVMDAILERVNPAELRTRSFAFYSGHGNHEHIYTYPTTSEDRGISLHRAVFLDALVSLLDANSTHFNKRCVSITESPTGSPKPLVVHFQDGTTFDADVVLGADGIKSSVRDVVLAGTGQSTGKRLLYSNTIAYRGLIPYAKLREAGFKTDLLERPVCLVGPSKHFILFNIKNGEIINVVAFAARYDIPFGPQKEGTPWVTKCSKDVLYEEYKGFGPDVAALLSLMPDEPSQWSIHVVDPPLESYARDRVALLGDAAHAMLPHMGSGAGQGVEDAYVLARLLGHPDTNIHNLEAVLGAYSTIRQPRAQMVWEGSRRCGRVYDLQGPSGPTLEGIRKDLDNIFDPVWHHDMESDIARAVGALQENGTFPSTA